MADIADEVPLPLLRWEANLHRAWYLLLGGNFVDAESHASRGVRDRNRSAASRMRPCCTPVSSS